MQQRNLARRRARNGKGLLPPNPHQWEIEHNGLDLREDLGLTLDESLPIEAAYELLHEVKVIPHGKLPVAQTHIEYFRRQGKSNWSGMGIPLPDGGTLVLFNDCHPPARIRATLMEEFYHLRLGHGTTKIRFYGANTAMRTHDPTIEGEAYGSGAAALLPYKGLRNLLGAGKTVEKIAKLYEVSTELVVFRAKVTKLYRFLSSRR